MLKENRFSISLFFSTYFCCFRQSPEQIRPHLSDSVGPAKNTVRCHRRFQLPTLRSPRANRDLCRLCHFRSAPFSAGILHPRFARHEKDAAPIPFHHPCEIVFARVAPPLITFISKKGGNPSAIGNLRKRLRLENAHIVHPAHPLQEVSQSPPLRRLDLKSPPQLPSTLAPAAIRSNWPPSAAFHALLACVRSRRRAPPSLAKRLGDRKNPIPAVDPVTNAIFPMSF